MIERISNTLNFACSLTGLTFNFGWPSDVLDRNVENAQTAQGLPAAALKCILMPPGITLKNMNETKAIVTDISPVYEVAFYRLQWYDANNQPNQNTTLEHYQLTFNQAILTLMLWRVGLTKAGIGMSVVANPIDAVMVDHESPNRYIRMAFTVTLRNMSLCLAPADWNDKLAAMNAFVNPEGDAERVGFN